MLEYKYSANLLLLISYCVKASSFDLFNSEYIYEYLFNFIETKPFNPMFELFEISSLNIVINSGSLLILFVIMIAAGIFYKLMMKLAKIKYKSKPYR